MARTCKETEQNYITIIINSIIIIIIITTTNIIVFNSYLYKHLFTVDFY